MYISRGFPPQLIPSLPKCRILNGDAVIGIDEELTRVQRARQENFIYKENEEEEKLISEEPSTEKK